MEYQNQILLGDCLDRLKDLPDDSVDLLVTDPPYGYSFMGKNWDKAVPSVDIWKECLRVLKPGAFAFIMSAPRQDVLSQMIVRIGEAGFDTDFTSIYWTYASGFPKAMNIGKMVDKRNGRDGEQHKTLGLYMRAQRDKLMTRRELAGLILPNYKNLDSAMAQISNWELGKNVPVGDDWQIVKPALQLDNRFDELIEREEAEREILATKTQTVGGNGIYGEFADVVDITAPATEKAKALDGSYGGAQFKPAVEVVIVAMKPMAQKTFVDSALEWQQKRQAVISEIEDQLKAQGIQTITWSK